MRLDKLWIKQFKNLQEVEIDFSEGDWVTVVIGWNGTGKSNVLESLVILFRDLELEKPKPAFAYKLEYRCRQQRIRIDADPERADSPYLIHVAPEGNEPIKGMQGSLLDSETPESEGWQAVSYAKFRQAKTQYLPSYVFGYYSGPSNRLEKHFDDHQKRFYDELIDTKRPAKKMPLRPLFYARQIHSHFVLLAFMLKQDPTVTEFLQGLLGVDPEKGVDSVLFVMREPSWKSKQGDRRFWRARGVVQGFLSRLYDIALAPVYLKRKVPLNFRKSTTKEHLYLFVRDTEALRKIVGDLPPYEFFKELESTYISELISEVRIRVRLRKSQGAVEFRELSEGEQQLLTVLGLLRFTAESESLFLLDEPDTHLNPSWAVEYLQFLEKFVGADSKTRESCHVLLATHNPLAIAALEKGQVQILTRGKDGLVHATTPELDPRGMRFANILLSDMFGLGSSLDKPTADELLKLHELSTKPQLTPEEAQKLENARRQLSKLDFNFASRDTLEQEFLRARRDLLSKEQVETAPITSAERKKAAVEALLEALLKEKS